MSPLACALACLAVVSTAAFAESEPEHEPEPLIAISVPTLVARAEVGPAWATAGGDRELGATVGAGVLVNWHLAAADLEVEGAAGESLLSAHPSAGVKVKILSTPENMGYTYFHAGARVARVGGETATAPVVGVRDFITYDVVLPWAFALQWRADLALDDMTVGGGVAVGFARAEERRGNLAVLIGWRRDRVELDGATYRSDGVTALVSHQWR